MILARRISHVAAFVRPSANIKKGQKKGKGKNEGVIIVRKHAKKVKKKVRKKRKMTSTKYSFLHHFLIF